ncbi:glycosyltransferase [Cellulomonas sp. PhB143]|uniref:glycosyltransferase n=1 Tax=Cellulomonas sp. PhB143 TaxID=2485186 RepID=UPI000F47F224|nr:glycosyltransferase [Cellulomonas sp. PhB143]ROS76641.1 glycosyltransferase involved in cell wall biosynthesis [Cellulomonas sp. PhB143]
MVAQVALRAVSVYEGFFSGGARVLHSTVVAGLHQDGQRHAALSIHEEVLRESLRQRMVDDPRYRMLVAAGVPVTTLGRVPDGGHDPRTFTDTEMAVAARAVEGADVVLTLKEQPLRLVNHAGFPDRPVVACLHRSDPEHQGPALDDLLAAAASGRLAAAVCCAESTREAYAAAGVPRRLLRVVPNGVDLARFAPVSAARRAALRGAFRTEQDGVVVAFSARYDTMKDVGLFLRAARVLLGADPRAHVLACGAGMSTANPALVADLGVAFGDRPDLLGRLHLLGVRHDMESVYAAADVVALTSAFGEAAPLCLIEGAMSGAVPVTTDVGDCASLVDGIGLVVGRDPAEVAAAWAQAAARRDGLARALETSRPRFSRTRMTSAYALLLESVVARQGRRSATARSRAAVRATMET